jgi:hypothetical protein
MSLKERSIPYLNNSSVSKHRWQQPSQTQTSVGKSADSVPGKWASVQFPVLWRSSPWVHATTQQSKSVRAVTNQQTRKSRWRVYLNCEKEGKKKQDDYTQITKIDKTEN